MAFHSFISYCGQQMGTTYGMAGRSKEMSRVMVKRLCFPFGSHAGPIATELHFLFFLLPNLSFFSRFSAACPSPLPSPRQS
ncbi:Uncharacterized protein APZ42_019285 [Daphnia magna]|uniref:Uncharacterized protein n=1 Tax=Daphnia magna TaxID=35525 RepID=A0A164YG83_9CRUS|nr:Uncharacterized protein APZ42_019285 [Daphnia magna]